MAFVRMFLIVSTGLILSLSLPSLYAQDKKNVTPQLDPSVSRLLGTWEIYQTKEPGQPYTRGYKGRPFVHKGPNAFTLILEYRQDGTFRRLTRIGQDEAVQGGTWKFGGNELRHLRKGASEEEVMYLRFDNKDQYTSIEVYESTSDPGLFAQFRRSNE